MHRERTESLHPQALAILTLDLGSVLVLLLADGSLTRLLDLDLLASLGLALGLSTTTRCSSRLALLRLILCSSAGIAIVWSLSVVLFCRKRLSGDMCCTYRQYHQRQ